MKNTKRQRIEKMMKKFRYADSYLINKFSARVYTHADLDKLEELLKREISHVYINRDHKEVVFGDADLYIWIEVSKIFKVSFKPLKSKMWGGKPHFTAIRRALNSTGFRRYFFGDENIKTCSNPSFEYIVDEGRDRVFYYSPENKKEEDFVFSSKEVLNDLDYKGINWELIPVDEKEYERLLDNNRFKEGGLIDNITIDLSSESLSENKIFKAVESVDCFELLSGHSDKPDKAYGKVISYRYGKEVDGERKYFVHKELEKELWKRIGVDVVVDPNFDDILVEEVVEEEMENEI